jgi:hypothetical protein
MVETQEPAPGKGNVDIPSVVALHPAAVALYRPTALQQSWELVVGVCDYNKLFTSVGAGEGAGAGQTMHWPQWSQSHCNY